MTKCESQCGVGAGANLQPVFRMGGDPGELGVDGDELGTALHALDNPMSERAVGVGDDGIIAPDEHVIRPLPLGVVVAVGEELGVIALVESAALQVRAERSRNIARLAREEAHGLVGRAKDALQQLLVDDDVATRAGGNINAFIAKLCLKGLDPGLDEVKRLVPRDALPRIRIAALLLGALHGIQLSVLVIHHVREGQATQAQTPLVVGVFGIALDVIDLPVLDVHEDTTVVVTSGCRTRIGTDNGEAVLFPRPLAPRRVVSGYGSRARLAALHLHIRPPRLNLASQQPPDVRCVWDRTYGLLSDSRIGTAHWMWKCKANMGHAYCA